MPSDLFRGSKGGRGLQACFDRLSTGLEDRAGRDNSVSSSGSILWRGGLRRRRSIGSEPLGRPYIGSARFHHLCSGLAEVALRKRLGTHSDRRGTARADDQDRQNGLGEILRSLALLLKRALGTPQTANIVEFDDSGCTAGNTGSESPDQRWRLRANAITTSP